MSLQEQAEDKVLEYMAAEGRFGRNLRWHWDASPDLAQATWEWPKRRGSSKALWHVYANDFWTNTQLVKATWAKP